MLTSWIACWLASLKGLSIKMKMRITANISVKSKLSWDSEDVLNCGGGWDRTNDTERPDRLSDGSATKLPIVLWLFLSSNCRFEGGFAGAIQALIKLQKRRQFSVQALAAKTGGVKLWQGQLLLSPLFRGQIETLLVISQDVELGQQDKVHLALFPGRDNNNG